MKQPQTHLAYLDASSKAREWHQSLQDLERTDLIEAELTRYLRDQDRPRTSKNRPAADCMDLTERKLAELSKQVGIEPTDPPSENARHVADPAVLTEDIYRSTLKIAIGKAFNPEFVGPVKDLVDAFPLVGPFVKAIASAVWAWALDHVGTKALIPLEILRRGGDQISE